MHINHRVAWILIFIASATSANPILPAGADYSPNVPPPETTLGYQVGDQHVRHDQLVAYYKSLDEASDRVRVMETGRTYEGRQQLLVVISHPDNLARLEPIRAQHLAVIEGEAEPAGAPVILWQGYSIHGDEPSGANAALLYAYHLAAAQSPEVLEKLREVVVLIEPALNPDGLARYAHWATSNASASTVTDPAARVHHQRWPSGRTNHYWFDLNRDYLLLQHPVSHHRVSQLVRWRPHVVTDHHEMGSRRTFFFQPGVPERTHPLTPARNQELTAAIAGFHARALDEAGRLYYTRESYDDFYYGKGSTYPDITGGVGILFEQAGSEGPAIKTPYGVRDFAFSVKNQFLTSLSTFEAAYALREELKDYQAGFFAQARELAASADGAGFVIGDAGDAGRGRAFVALLLGHGLEVRPVTEDVELDGHTYRAGHAWFVPFDQTQYRFIEAAFETRTEFPSHVFYDVSAWTLPLAFDLPFAVAGSTPEVEAAIVTLKPPEDHFRSDAEAVAYAFEWSHLQAPTALQALLGRDVIAMGTTKPFTAVTRGGEHAFQRGAIVVPLGLQPEKQEAIRDALEAAALDGIRVFSLQSGMTPQGIELGSPSLEPIEPVKPVLVVGDGINPYEAGQVWFLLDRRLRLPLVMVNRDRFERLDLHDYTHLILVGGDYDDWDPDQAQRLHQWIADGGVLITQQKAAQWATEQKLMLDAGARQAALDKPADCIPPSEGKGSARSAGTGQVSLDKPAECIPPSEGRGFGKDAKTIPSGQGRPAKIANSLELAAGGMPPPRADYADYPQDFAETLISGTIFMTDLDTTHPLGFGISDRALPVFKNGTVFLEPSDNPYETVARYNGQPLLAGYVSDARLKEVAGSAALLADRVGQGVLIRFADNPNFRAMWYGTQRLFVNALYFGRAVGSTSLPD